MFDTTACLRPQQLFDVERLATAAQPLPVADLGWLRLGALRALFAGLFDPPVGGAPLVQAGALTIEHRAGCDASALLLLAWLGVLLGWRPLRSAQTSDGGVRFDFARAGQPVAGHLVPADGACGRSGILGVEASRRAAIATPSAAPRSTRPCCRRRACRPSRSSWTRPPTPSWRRRARIARPRSAVRALPQLRAPALVARARDRRQQAVAQHGSGAVTEPFFDGASRDPSRTRRCAVMQRLSVRNVA